MMLETRHHFASEPYNEIDVLWKYCWWLVTNLTGFSNHPKGVRSVWAHRSDYLDV